MQYLHLNTVKKANPAIRQALRLEIAISNNKFVRRYWGND